MANKESAQSKANSARMRAAKQLIEENKPRYEELLVENRRELGLPGNPDEARLEGRMNKLRKQLAELEAEHRATFSRS